MADATHPRPGGRSARVVHDVLEATLDLLAARGFAALVVEEVAARARVAKTTIYRRWPTKGELVCAALLSHADDAPASPDTGSVRGDLVALLLARVRRLSKPRGRAIARAVLGGVEDPEVAAMARSLRARRPLIPTLVLERAVARRELPPGVDVELLVALLSAPIHERLLWRGEAVDGAWLAALVDVVVSGFGRGRPGAKPGRTRTRRGGRTAPANKRARAH